MVFWYLKSFFLGSTTSELWVQRGTRIWALCVSKAGLIWRGLQHQRQRHRLHVCCQKGMTIVTSLKSTLLSRTFAMLTSVRFLNVYVDDFRCHWWVSALRRWARGVPCSLLGWWNSLEWYVKVHPSSCLWTSNQVRTYKLIHLYAKTPFCILTATWMVHSSSETSGVLYKGFCVERLCTDLLYLHCIQVL